MKKTFIQMISRSLQRCRNDRIIECNCVDAYMSMIETEPTFRCIYEVVGYDGISLGIYNKIYYKNVGFISGQFT